MPMTNINTSAIANAFSKHHRVGFQFSGGRDSTAALYLLKPLWGRMTVYHVDSGDQFPEIRAVVARVAEDVHIEFIHGAVGQVQQQHGMPSDLVPVDATEIGRMVSGRPTKIQSRYDCCARTLMLPMHQRMRDDGITLLVRGQRDDEFAEPPLRSGAVADGFELLYPIQHWTGAEVSSYLESNGLPVAPFYAQGMNRAPGCMGCTAWWDEGRARYLRQNHPEAHAVYMHRMADITKEISQQSAWLNREMESLNG